MHKILPKNIKTDSEEVDIMDLREYFDIEENDEMASLPDEATKLLMSAAHAYQLFLSKFKFNDKELSEFVSCDLIDYDGDDFKIARECIRDMFDNKKSSMVISVRNANDFMIVVYMEDGNLLVKETKSVTVIKNLMLSLNIDTYGFLCIHTDGRSFDFIN